MIVPFKRAESIQTDAPVSRGVPLIDARADYPTIEPRDRSDRKLRNRIILANTIAWIVITAFVRYVLF
jgi:hypothetical protein